MRERPNGRGSEKGLHPHGLRPELSLLLGDRHPGPGGLSGVSRAVPRAGRRTRRWFAYSEDRQRGRARACRPATARPCSHGRPRGCQTVHEPDDEHLGEPLCPECFDYRRAVIWNALATELWRRNAIATTRALAAQAGVTVTALSRVARLSYVKVVEYQRRGVIHLHVVARLLDGPTGPEPRHRSRPPISSRPSAEPPQPPVSPTPPAAD